MKKIRWLSVLLALVLLFSLGTVVFAVDSEQTGSEEVPAAVQPELKAAVQKPLHNPQYKPGDQVRVIVLMNGQPTADNVHAFQRQINAAWKLKTQQSAALKMMDDKQIGYKVNFQYTALLNGMSLTVDYVDLDKIAALPGVSQVIIPTVYDPPVMQPGSNSASEMINATTLSDYFGADGSGKVIAVVDTGITADHEAFGVYDGMLQTPAWEKVDMIKAIAGIGHGMYVSQKVPYQFDYADQDNDAIDDQSGHGSHVSGIAAGYVVTPEGEITFHGSAPDAQILAMKVFSSDPEVKGTSSDIYFAALEDAYTLGADVINMSLGAPNGFVEDAESVLNDRIYERLENAGIICCIAAGNEDSMAEYAQNWAGPGYVTSDYTDYGVLGSPASYNGNVAVAAMENAEYPAYLIAVGEDEFAFLDHNGTAFHDAFAGQDLEYVMVPDLGVAEAYKDLNVRGKIAVISRGEITFEDKVAYASAAGAVGVIVYNNQPGALISMAVTTNTIPAVFVSDEAGAALAAAAEAKLHVNEKEKVVENPEGWTMASFSSWGPTNDLQIKPNITGVGGNVYSVLAGTADRYEVESGTSMSTPNVSGGYAALLEAICADNPDMSKAEAAALARNRTLSHASVAIDYRDGDEESGYVYVPYSPRRQGAGLMDLAAAYSSKLAIADPLAELGDDAAKTGVFTINAELENTGDAERTYEVSLDVLTDAPANSPWGTIYNAMQSMLLEEDVDFTTDAPESITLAPGEKQTVTVTITLTDDAKAFLDEYFANGSFIEGYLYFTFIDYETYEYEPAHVTFMGFYGDWSAAPIIETHDWREMMNVEIDPEYSRDPCDYVLDMDWEINTDVGKGYLIDSAKLFDEGQLYGSYAGAAPFGYPEGGKFMEQRIAVSADPNAMLDTLYFEPTVIRNARHIIMIARDAETNEIYAVDDTPFVSKTIYDAEYGVFDRTVWFLFDGTNSYTEDGTPIADDTQVAVEFYANLPYGEDALGSMTPEEIVADGGQYLQYTIPVVVDSTGPEITVDSYDAETGEVTVTVSDNQYLNAVYAVDAEGNDLDEVLFADETAGESHTVTLNVGEQEGLFYVAACDFATNESFKVVGEHEHEWSEWAVLAEPDCENDGLQGRMCAICGEIEYEPISALGHSLQEVAAVPATCEEDGVIAHYQCVVCGKLFSDADGANEIEEADTVEPALGHKLDKAEAVAAGCEEDGNIEFYTCSVCGKLFSDAEGKNEITAADTVLKATGHKLVKTDAVAATCEEAGNIEYWTCSACGKLFSDAEGENEITKADTVLMATGHTTILQDAKDATCTEEGYTGDFYCIDCKKVVKQGETIAKLPHALTMVDAVAATCENDGVVAHFKCSDCGKLFSDAEGKTEITAADTVVKATGHELVKTEAVAATCEKDGNIEYYTCSNCGKLFSDAEDKNEITEADTVVKATGHELVKTEAVAATCEKDGNIEYYTCSVCGKLYSDAEGTNEITKADTVVKATGHTTILQDAKDATCEEDGYTGDVYCIDCKKVVKQGETIAKLSHDAVKTEEVPATCEEDGVAAYWTCSRCGKLFADEACTAEIEKPEVLAALGHDWDDGVVTVEPTLASEGEKLYTCKNDPSHTYTVVLDKLSDCDGGDNCPSKDFTDVDHGPKSWSHKAIDWAVLENITRGTSKTTFSPNKACTRAEAVTFLWRAAGCPEPQDSDSPFTDVTLDKWYAKAVLWAVENGITKGTTATTFSPDDTCTRGQIVTFLWRFAEKPASDGTNPFDDVKPGQFFTKAVLWAVGEHITKGTTKTTFSPNDPCTRAEIVTFLYRYMG